MRKQFLKILPWLAIISLLVLVVLIILTSIQRSVVLVETLETRQSSLYEIKNIQDLNLGSVESEMFKEEIDRALQNPDIVTVWLYAPDGRLVYRVGSMTLDGSAQERATEEMKRVLSTLSDDALDEGQRVLLLAASAIQSEGEHNDIYRHLLRGIYSSEDDMIGIIGLAYHANPAIGDPGVWYRASIVATLLSFCIYWLSLPLWVLMDARQRGERARLWAAFVLFGNLVALIAYLLVRKTFAQEK
jgi:hypothetical protein